MDAPALRRAATTGALFGAVAVYLAMVGLLLAVHARWIVVGHLSMAHALLVATALGAGCVAARRHTGQGARLAGMLAGTVAAAVLSMLVVLMAIVDLRWMFIALSKPLFQLLTFGGGPARGLAVLLGSGLACGVLAAQLLRMPRAWRRPLVAGAATALGAGTFQELLQLMLQTHASLDGVREWFFSWDGLSVVGALRAFVLGAVLSLAWTALAAPRGAAAIPPGRLRRVAGTVALLLAVGALPLIGGSYIGQIMMLVALYVLMGMGLNLEVGLAGLLDLGFVAFFAVGAYTTALLSGDNPHALAALSFWTAMPVAVLMAVGVGLLFGLPVLGMRGDYLAVATLGLGEIVRVVVSSDAASPLLGGAQGLLQVPRPSVAGHALNSPIELFYVTLAAALVAAYVAWRLDRSRLGRAWRAVRDDEDVAEALGVNLVGVKLLAYGLGAGFAGLAGSIFASMVGSVYPSSFQLAISINVLALIVVGGTGSLPGVIVGAAVLVGLPELLREFGEYRYLFHGAALIVMMRLRPQGLWPSALPRHEPPGSAPGRATP